MRLRWLAPALLVTGCQLAEVTTPASEELPVVEAVLRTDMRTQHVLLHRTLRGATVGGEPNARVSVVTPEGARVALLAHPLERCAANLEEVSDSIRIEASCYSGELAVVPGGTYELHVETADGRVLRGRTRVPGNFQLRVPHPATGEACALPPGTHLEVVWGVAEGAWSYVARVGIRGLDTALAPRGIEAPGYLELTGLAVSAHDTTVVLPREFGIFERLEVEQAVLRALQEGLPEGVQVELVVAAADRNYVNGVRGGGFNPSGNVRIPSVVGGGTGVFASLVPRRVSIQVDHDLALRPCAGAPVEG